MIDIKNGKTYNGDGFYIGRPSPLGNPFKIDSKTSRASSIAQYREWFTKRVQTDTPTQKAFKTLIEEYREKGELILICWCAPLQCHGEVIREFILKYCNREDD